MTTRLTSAQQDAIRDFLRDRHIPAGLGTREEACSVAAINIALSGKLTDTIPDCMSEVVGLWMIRIQDLMSDEARNSIAWRYLLPLAAGTGRYHETERLTVARDAMWEALAWVQGSADAKGFGTAWRRMLERRTPGAAAEAADAAADASDIYAAAAGRAAYGIYGAARDAAMAAAEATYAAEARDYDEWAIRTLERLIRVEAVL